MTNRDRNLIRRDTYSDDSHYGHVRHCTDLSLSQDIIYGSISLILYNEDYWNDTIRYWLCGIDYYYTLNADNSQDEDDDTEDSNDQQISINISIPLDAFMPSTYVTYNMNSAKDGDTTHTVGLTEQRWQRKISHRAFKQLTPLKIRPEVIIPSPMVSISPLTYGAFRAHRRRPRR